MITARQTRAARALLGWSQETLADKALVSLTALKRLESESGLKVHESTRDQVRRMLEEHGIVFLSSDQGEGVMIVRRGDQSIKHRVERQARGAGAADAATLVQNTSISDKTR
jgi:predicted transcriptional regulator